MTQKEMGQATGLVLGIVLVGAFVAFQLKGANGGSSSAPADKPAVTDQASTPIKSPDAAGAASASGGTPPAGAPGQAAPQKKVSLIDTPPPTETPVPNTSAEPFKKVGDQSAPTSTTTTSIPRVRTPEIQPLPVRDLGTPGQGVHVTSTGDGLKLLGIVTDPDGQVVVLSNGSAILNLQKGDKVSGYRISRVTATHVSLQMGKATFTLGVGDALTGVQGPG